MWGTDGTSRKYKRLRGVTRAFQVSTDEVERQTDEPSNILDKHPRGSVSFNKGISVRPEVAVILRASALAGKTERLARDASGHKVNVSKVGGIVFTCYLLDI